jgi:hypothetical protein
MAATAGAQPSDVWRQDDRTLDSPLFPAETAAAGFSRWLWMYRPETAAPECLRAWLEAPRFSCAEIALLARPDAFHSRRREIWTQL